jgi:hypothetical protein
MKTIVVGSGEYRQEYSLNDPNLRVVLGYGLTVRLLVDGPHGAAGRVVHLATSVALQLLAVDQAEPAA